VESGGELYLPIHFSSLRMDSVPPFDLYFQPTIAQPFVLYCEKNTAFTKKAMQNLRLNKTEELFIHQGQRNAYQLYLAEHLEDIITDHSLTARDKASILYDSVQVTVEEILSKPAKRKTIRQGKSVVSHTVDFMRREEFKLTHLLRNISCDYYLYTHSVNVVAYSTVLALGCGYSDGATLREIANGALLHDVGKGTLPKQLLNKKGAFTAKEWKQMQEHPVTGHELLLKEDCLGEIALDIVLHHHEKCDGKGYPHGLKGEEISPFVHIVALADIFDALTTERYHQKARSTFDALKIMQRDMRKELDPDILKCFMKVMAG
jgi:HD-GYP domain-containing protein (c-di-GMP phosphodiesterase class II)